MRIIVTMVVSGMTPFEFTTDLNHEINKSSEHPPDEIQFQTTDLDGKIHYSALLIWKE